MQKFTTHFICLMMICLTAVSLQGQGGQVPKIKDAYRKEVKKLGATDKVKNAFDWIQKNDNQTIRDHIFFTEIPAPPFKEEKRAEALLGVLISAGVDSAWIDEVGNVIALRKGTKGNRTVVLDAHTDTVFPEGTDVKVRMKGDTFYAPGIGDDTRGIAMIICVLRAMNAVDIETEADILFIGTVGEEGLGDLRGVKHLFASGGPKIDSWISIDGGEIGRVNNKGLGSIRYRVTFKGPGGHSWGAFGLGNPHHALGTAIHYFVQEADRFTSYGARTSYNVGVIGGGTSVNSIPFESSMEIDMRSVSPERLDSIDAILQKAVQKALIEQNKIARIGHELTVDVEKIGERPSGELPEDLPLIQRAIATTAFFGKVPRLTRGSTNSNIPISLGIPAVTIGRGGKAQNAHSLNEWWLNDEGYKSIQLALLLLVSESGLSE